MGFQFILLALVVGRVTRYITSDTMFEETRDRLVIWLKDPVQSQNDDGTFKARSKRKQVLGGKLGELITCPWCVSIYVSAGTVFVHRLIVEPLPQPVWWWLALSMTAVLFIEFTDGVREIILKKDHSH